MHLPTEHVDVLVVGAGPTGSTAAIEAVRHGLTVRIIDRKPSRSRFSKALVAHARTLEIFETMGVIDPVLAAGAKFTALNVHTGRKRRGRRVDLLGLPWGDTAYPFWLSLPQYSTEQILEQHLGGLGVDVEWSVSLEELHDRGDYVEARLAGSDGKLSAVHSRWLIGCDGGRSRVRQQAGLRLDRATAGATFVLADVKTTAPLAEDEGHVFVVPEGLLFIVPMPERGRWRIIAHEPTATAGTDAAIDAAYLDDVIRSRAGIEFGSHDVTWQSRFELSHGVSDGYRRGRVFLAGDAAHVHSPVGGQGLNTGVQDAHNLLWKLGLARRMPDGEADELLDSYETERRAVGHTMVMGVARVTGLLTTRNSVLRQLFGVLAPLAVRRPAFQGRLGRSVGMLEIGYAGGTGSPGAGRRMPNPGLRAGGRLYERLDPVRHTWVVRRRLGELPADPDDPRWQGLPVVCLSDEELTDPDGAGLDDMPKVILVRPDRYVGAIDRARSLLGVA